MRGDNGANGVVQGSHVERGVQLKQWLQRSECWNSDPVSFVAVMVLKMKLEQDRGEGGEAWYL